MGMSLKEIKEILEYKNPRKIIDSFKDMENRIDKQIEELNYAKKKIGNAKSYYKNKLESKMEESFILEFKERKILLSKDLETPNIRNLYHYFDNFYGILRDDLKDKFKFEDVAGVYTENGVSRLFALCNKYAETEGLITLPKGKYLCTNTSIENSNKCTDDLINISKSNYKFTPKFIVKIVLVSGILSFDYQIQVYLGE